MTYLRVRNSILLLLLTQQQHTCKLQNTPLFVFQHLKKDQTSLTVFYCLIWFRQRSVRIYLVGLRMGGTFKQGKVLTETNPYLNAAFKINWKVGNSHFPPIKHCVWLRFSLKCNYLTPFQHTNMFMMLKLQQVLSRFVWFALMQHLSPNMLDVDTLTSTTNKPQYICISMKIQHCMFINLWKQLCSEWLNMYVYTGSIDGISCCTQDFTLEGSVFIISNIKNAPRSELQSTICDFPTSTFQ